MKTRLFTLLFALGFVLIPSRSRAAEIDYWKTYNTSNSDLINNTILSLAVDSSANLWVGTDGGGVCKFDGVEWTTYNSADYSNSSNVVSAITVSPTGDVWIGLGDYPDSEANAVCKYDAGTDSWTEYASVGTGSTFGIGFDLNGDLWATGSYWWSPNERGTIKLYDDGTSSWVTKGSEGDRYGYKCLAIGPQGDVFAGLFYNLTSACVYRYVAATQTPTTLWQNISGGPDPFTGAVYIKGMAFDNQGDLWIATGNHTADGGLLKYDEGGSPEWSIIKSSTVSPAGAIPHEYMTCVATDHLGNVWLGAGGSSGGVCKYNITTDTWMANPYTTTNPVGGLGSNSITAIVADKYGTVWFGTSGGGVSLRSEFSIAPASAQSTYPPGNNFQVDIDVSDVLDLYGTSFVLHYDQTSYISVVSTAEGDFLDADPNNLVFTSNTATAGEVSIGVSRQSGAGIDGSGTVASVIFTADASTPANTDVTFSLSSVVSVNSTGSDIFIPLDDLTVTIHGLLVWPGDADNSGTVDQSDILPLGTYWHTTGTARSSASRQWTAQSCEEWTTSDATYADCDGNGYIDQADILPIGLNWSETHSLLLASAGDLPDASSASLDADALKTDLRVLDESTNLYELSLELDPLYRETFRGISFAVTGLDGTKIVKVVRGEAWSGDALFIRNSIDGRWGVGITETRESTFGGANSGFMLAKVTFCAPEKGLDLGSMISLSEIKFSLTTDETLSVASSIDILHSLASEPLSLPKAFALEQNTPNPFNPTTTISYSIPEGNAARVTLKIYDLRGQLVRNLLDRNLAPGTHSIFWDGTDESGHELSSGVYLYRMRSRDFVQTRKMVLLK
jgi:FlgD Ig-like domain/Cohesin domain/Two component regulator propeller